MKKLDAGAVSNAEAAEGASNPAAREAEYEEWGRVSGRFASFSSENAADEPEEIAYFECALDRYEDVRGADQAFRVLSDETNEQATAALNAQGFEDVEFSEIPAPQIGDETEVAGGTAVRDDQNFEFFAVTFRRLNMLGYSLSAAPERFSFVEDAANISALMVRLLDEQIEEAEEASEDD